MKHTDLIDEFQTMYKEHWSYVWGAAEKGCVDCSGAFVYAYKKYKQSIYHGSNTIARSYIKGKLLPISECRPGYAVFKHRDDGGEPEKYRGDGIGNIYHIGLAGSDGRVLNAQGQKAGFTNTPLSTWHFCAPLKGVDYSQESDGMTCKVTGGTLNVRKECSTTSKLLCRAPDGASMGYIGEADEGWSKVTYNGFEGYVLTKYIILSGEETKADDMAWVKEQITALYSEISNLKADIAAMKAEMERY